MRGSDRCLSAEAAIAAPPEAVWAVLADLARYGEWNPLCVAAEGELAVGAALRFDVRLAGRRVVSPEVVVALEPPRRLAWRWTGLPRWLYRSDREQTVTPDGAGRCRYRTTETLAGPLAGLIGWLVADAVQEGFDAMAEALRRRVESGVR